MNQPTDLHTALQREREAWQMASWGRASYPAVEAAQRATDEALSALRDALAEVAASTVERDDPRRDYVSIALDRDTWAAIRRGASVPPPPTWADVERAIKALSCWDLNHHTVLDTLAALFGRGEGVDAEPDPRRALYGRGGVA